MFAHGCVVDVRVCVCVCLFVCECVCLFVCECVCLFGDNDVTANPCTVLLHSAHSTVTISFSYKYVFYTDINFS